MHQIFDRGSNHKKGNLKQLNKYQNKSFVDSLVYTKASTQKVNRLQPDHYQSTRFKLFLRANKLSPTKI